MFTGLTEEIGYIINIQQYVETGQTILTIGCKIVLQEMKLGDSIAINGVCLTVTSFTANQFTVGLSPETLKITNLSDLKINTAVNLERSLKLNSKIGGHFVQGHVDVTGTIIVSEKNGDSWRIVIKTTPDFIKFVVKKGCIAIDGVSLTVVDVTNNTIEVMLIQYTVKKVTLAKKAIGQRVNLEADILGKQIVSYLEKYINSNNNNVQLQSKL